VNHIVFPPKASTGTCICVCLKDLLDKQHLITTAVLYMSINAVCFDYRMFYKVQASLLFTMSVSCIVIVRWKEKSQGLVIC